MGAAWLGGLWALKSACQTFFGSIDFFPSSERGIFA